MEVTPKKNISYYEQNKEIIKANAKIRYHENVEYREKKLGMMREYSRDYYLIDENKQAKYDNCFERYHKDIEYRKKKKLLGLEYYRNLPTEDKEKRLQMRRFQNIFK